MIKIFDTTLRDGEQTPGVSLTPDKKLRIAKMLDEANVDIIEGGFASVSEGDFQALKLMAKENLNAEVCSMTRANIQDIDTAIKTEVSGIHLVVPTSKIHLEYKLRKSMDEVLNLTQKANLPMPKLYIIPSDTPNAFATGRNPHHAAVAVTSGILKLLNKDELEGVLGHELSHIKHRDILISSIVATVVGAIMMLAHMARWMAIFGGFRRSDEDSSGIFELLAMIIIAPIAAVLIQLAISRAREYSADEGSAKITGKPLSLASALEKLEAYSKRIPMDVNPSTAHMFIVNPLKGKDILALFSTHPPVEKRIERLRKLAYAY